MDLNTFLGLPTREYQVGPGIMTTTQIGVGPTVALLHGNSTWSYQWRSIVPLLAERFHCVLPDLIGFGRSDRVDHYDWDVHFSSIESLLNQLGPTILVGHDWGGALAASFALHHKPLVRGLVLMESQLFAETWSDYVGERRRRFEALRDPAVNRQLIEVENEMVEGLPNNVLRDLSTEEMDGYRYPYPLPKDRTAMRRFAEMKPIGAAAETMPVFDELQNRMGELDMPVLLLTVDPGALISEKRILEMSHALSALEVVRLGEGRHHFQEDHPEAISRAICAWASRHGLEDGRFS